MLETLGPETMNIKDLSVEEQAKNGQPFNPEKDLDLPSFKHEIMTRLKEEIKFIGSKDVANLEQMFELMEEAALFCPDSEKVAMAENFPQQMQAFSREGPSIDRFDILLNGLLRLKLYSPQLYQRFKLDEDGWSAFELNYRHVVSSEVIKNILEMAAQVKMLNPNKLEQHISPTTSPDILWQQGFDLFCDERKSDRDDKYIYMARLAKSLKILFPEKFSELNLDQDFWQGMKKLMNSFNDERQQHLYREYAALMQFLVAEKIDINEEEIKITFPEFRDDLTPNIPLPETRNF